MLHYSAQHVSVVPHAAGVYRRAGDCYLPPMQQLQWQWTHVSLSAVETVRRGPDFRPLYDDRQYMYGSQHICPPVS